MSRSSSGETDRRLSDPICRGCAPRVFFEASTLEASAREVCVASRPVDVENVVAVVDGIPHMPPKRGREIYKHVVDEGIRDVLELGFAHGVSTCYLAAAVDETGGRVLTLDKRSARKRSPSLWTLADSLELMHLITPVLAERSFTWELMRIMRDTPERQFEFVFLDGGHTWDVTGFAFCLADRMLKPGGWMLFDDLDWTIKNSPSVSGTGISDEEANTAQVGLVFDILVAPHYETRRDGQWGWARKRSRAAQAISTLTQARARKTI